MPATASNMPRIVPSTPETTARIRVFGRPVSNRSGNALRYNDQSKKVAPSCESVDFGATAAVAPLECCAAMAAKSGSCGVGAALDPGFQPGGSTRGSQLEYSLA